MIRDTTWEQAVKLMVEDVDKMEAETCRLRELPIGRVLAQDVTAKEDQPPFPRSPLDGYALAAKDIQGACPEKPVTLKVIDKIYAGGGSVKPVTPGAAVRIMTGAMLPEGCDCVIRQEDTDGGEEEVSVRASLQPYENYCFQGEDYKAGEMLLPAGTYLDAAAIGVAASAGAKTLKLCARPSVSVISTGDELIPVDEDLKTGKIYDSNRFYIHARLVELDARIGSVSHAGDQMMEIIDKIKSCIRYSDLIITTGGVSVGQKDLMPVVMEKLGAEIVFHGASFKPGSPALFAKYKGKRILCLSGNPFAAAATFELLARPFLAALTGNSRFCLKRVKAVLESGFGKESKNRRFIRGRYDGKGVRLPQSHASGQLRSMIGCNCLVDIPGGTGRLTMGDQVEVLLIS